MQDFAKSFYSGAQWKATRAAYRKSVHGLCERCLAAGKYNPAVIIHHRTPLTPDNISDPNISLSFSNLQALCRDCHAAVHNPEGEKRYTVDEMGRVIIK